MGRDPGCDTRTYPCRNSAPAVRGVRPRLDRPGLEPRRLSGTGDSHPCRRRQSGRRRGRHRRDPVVAGPPPGRRRPPPHPRAVRHSRPHDGGAGCGTRGVLRMVGVVWPRNLLVGARRHPRCVAGRRKDVSGPRHAFRRACVRRPRRARRGPARQPHALRPHRAHQEPACCKPAAVSWSALARARHCPTPCGSTI